MNTLSLLPCLAVAGVLSIPGIGHAQAITAANQAGPFGARQAVPRTTTWYVDSNATGAGHGHGWAGAFNDLQQALFAAQDGDQIWVAAGTYVPAPPGGVQSATFLIPSGVEVYGGFNGSETQLAQRNPALNVTVLSGDINGDDVTTPANFNIGSPNSWNIVMFINASAATRVDGFELETGHLYLAPGDLAKGAGMHLKNSSPTIANCEFSYCVASEGAAMFSDIGSPVVENCTFSNNFATGAACSGGAISTEGGLLTVRDSEFTNNSAEANTGSGRGGAIINRVGATIVEGCTFTNNRAVPRFGNSYTVSLGGAIYVSSGNVQVNASSFFDNESNVGGAIATSFFGTPTCEILNSVFADNFVSTAVTSGGWDIGGDGGAIYGSAVSVVDVIGCMVTGGTADNCGGALIDNLGTVSSSIFWGNSDNKGTIGKSQVEANRVYYSCVMKMLIGEPGEDAPDPQKFPGSIALDPLFINAGLNNFRLQAGSPCIDAGANPDWPVSVLTDRDGNPRFVDSLAAADTGVGPGPVVDMGPYEKQQ